MRPPSYPSAWLRRRRARFRFAWQNYCSSTTSIGLNFPLARLIAQFGRSLEHTPRTQMFERLVLQRERLTLLRSCEQLVMTTIVDFIEQP
jgi:hypothetical protein